MKKRYVLDYNPHELKLKEDVKRRALNVALEHSLLRPDVSFEGLARLREYRDQLDDDTAEAFEEYFGAVGEVDDDTAEALKKNWQDLVAQKPTQDARIKRTKELATDAMNVMVAMKDLDARDKFMKLQGRGPTNEASESALKALRITRDNMGVPTLKKTSKDQFDIFDFMSQDPYFAKLFREGSDEELEKMGYSPTQVRAWFQHRREKDMHNLAHALGETKDKGTRPVVGVPPRWLGSGPTTRMSANEMKRKALEVTLQEHFLSGVSRPAVKAAKQAYKDAKYVAQEYNDTYGGEVDMEGEVDHHDMLKKAAKKEYKDLKQRQDDARKFMVGTSQKDAYYSYRKKK